MHSVADSLSSNHMLWEVITAKMSAASCAMLMPLAMFFFRSKNYLSVIEEVYIVDCNC